MKHLLLIMSLTLVGCGGGSSTVVSEPIAVIEPVTPIEVPICPEVIECPEIPVEVEPVSLPYYQVSTVVTDELEMIEEYEYDNGNKTSYTKTVKGIITEHDLYFYENNNLIRSEIDANGVGQYYITIYTYDGDTLVSEYDNDTDTLVTYTYDEYGNVILAKTEAQNGTIVFESVYTWQEFTEEIK